MAEEKIAVVVPVYNVEQYLERCVNSIIGQTYTALEIILVDDGSTDCSGVMCDEFTKRDERIRAIHKENGGLSDARNVGIAQASGEFITFIDSDDFILPDMIERLYSVKTKYNTPIACCLMQQVTDEDQGREYSAAGQPGEECLTRVEALERMLRQNGINCSAWAKLYDISLFNDVEYPKGEIYEDLGTTYKLLAKAERVAIVHKEGYCYYKRSGSIQVSPFKIEKLAEYRFAMEQKAFLDARFPELKMATTDRLVSCCFHILFGMDGGFLKERKMLEDTIRKNRGRLVFAKGTSRKTRFGCLLSYFGFGMERKIYEVLGIRGRMVD